MKDLAYHQRMRDPNREAARRVRELYLDAFRRGGMLNWDSPIPPIIGGARKVPRAVDTFTPTESQTVRRRMPIGLTTARYIIRFTGTLTVGVAVATILEDSPLGFIRNLELSLNGSFPLRSWDARAARFWNVYQQKTAPVLTAPSGAIGASNFVAEFTVDLEQVDLLPPNDRSFWLDTRRYSSVELVWTFGAAADVATLGGGGTVALSALSIEVLADEVADLGGPASRMQASRQQQALTATGDTDIQLPALGPLYRAVALHFTSGNADPIRATSDDTILTSATLIGDNILRHVDAARYRNIRSENKGIAQAETFPAGWAVLDFAKAKHLADLVRTERTRQLILRLNVAAVPANTFVQTYPINALLLQRRPATGRPNAAALR